MQFQKVFQQDTLNPGQRRRYRCQWGSVSGRRLQTFGRVRPSRDEPSVPAERGGVSASRSEGPDGEDSEAT